MKQFIKENWFKIILAVCAITITLTYVWVSNVQYGRNSSGIKVNLENSKDRLPGLPSLR